jgi:hypothetical protein
MHARYLILTDHCKFAICFGLPTAYHIQFLNDDITELIHFEYHFVLLNQFCELEIAFSFLIGVSVWLLSTPTVKEAPATEMVNRTPADPILIAYHIAQFD